MICRNCNSVNEDDAVFCSKCGEPFDGKSIKKPLGMKWFKFIIYGQLILMIIMSIMSVYMLMDGYVYFDGPINITQQVYNRAPLMKTIDMIYVIIIMMMTIFTVYVRHQLAKYRTNAVNIFLFFLVISALVSLSQTGLSYVIAKADPLDFVITSFVIELIWTGSLLLINFDYFKKRKHLFIN